MVKTAWSQTRGFVGGMLTVAVLGAAALTHVRAQETPAPKFLNPYSGNPDILPEARKLFLSNGCNACHGLMGGGGMGGKPFLDDEWVFGSDDETLYKLIKGQIPKQTMPKAFASMPDDQVWKLVSYVRSMYRGDPAKITWSLKPVEGLAAPEPAAPKPASAFKPPLGLQDMDITTPDDNPMTEGRMKLGEKLFFDKRLSKTKAMACDTCHQPDHGWADVVPASPRCDGTKNTRRTPTLFSVAYLPELSWDGRNKGLEAQVQDDLKTQMGADLDQVAKDLEAIAGYKSAFEAEFQGGPTSDRIVKALATFVRTIQAGDTPYDRGDEKAKAGFQVFSEVGHCTLCHLPPIFTDTLYHNVGVGAKAKPVDVGRAKLVSDAAEVKTMTGAFKTPSLRGVGLRGRFFHDGSAKTYVEAANVMMKGGIDNPNKDEKLKAWPATAAQKQQILDFLKSLTPESKPYQRPELPQ